MDELFSFARASGLVDRARLPRDEHSQAGVRRPKLSHLVVILRGMTSAPGFDNRVAVLAARQCGALARRQAIALGATDPMIARRLRSGRWRRVHPGVYVLSGVPPSWRQEVWCALLAVGPAATVTHESALRLHGVERVALRPLSVSAPQGSHPRVPGAFVHQIADLEPGHVTRLDGLPVSRVERAVVEVAGSMGIRQLGHVVDDVVWSRRTGLVRIGECLAQVARPGKPGIVKLARVLDQRSDGPVPAASELERSLFGALAAGGLPAPTRQMPLPGRGVVDGLVDAAYSDARLIVEADGRRWHTRIHDLKNDHLRDAEAARVGWLTLRLLYEQITRDPAEVCATVADVRSTRLKPRLAARQ
jgi:Protein of unknown function (DUF559)/Transcriptional regulator, AbiEi antitoxin